MADTGKTSSSDSKGIWEMVQEKLERLGLGLEEVFEGLETQVKVVCVTPDLTESVREMSRSQRDQVVMVRVDEETSKTLDAWVETGAVKSRSEAAALFIREGLNVRATELEKLKEALKGVEEAKERLREKAREVFGEEGGSDDSP